MFTSSIVILLNTVNNMMIDYESIMPELIFRFLKFREIDATGPSKYPQIKIEDTTLPYVVLNTTKWSITTVDNSFDISINSIIYSPFENHELDNS